MRKTRHLSQEVSFDAKAEFGCFDSQNQVTLREFDSVWLPTVEPLQPFEIRGIREKMRVSQAVFARLMNTSLSTIQKWEIGQKKPTGSALKLLRLVQKFGLAVVAWQE